jgi:prefoldin subunit 5
MAKKMMTLRAEISGLKEQIRALNLRLEKLEQAYETMYRD